MTKHQELYFICNVKRWNNLGCSLQSSRVEKKEVRQEGIYIYYAYQLSMQQGKFRAYVLPLKLCCCQGRQSQFLFETSRAIDVISLLCARDLRTFDFREFKKTTTATATGTSLNKRFNE